MRISIVRFATSFFCLTLLSLLVFSACTVTKSTKPNKRYDVEWHVLESLNEYFLDCIGDISDSAIDRNLKTTKAETVGSKKAIPD